MSLQLCLPGSAWAQNGFQLKLSCFRPRGIVPAKGGKTFGVANYFKQYYPPPGIDTSGVFMLDNQGHMVWSRTFAGIYVERYNVYSDTVRGRYFAVGTCGGSNYYETQQNISVYCFSDSGRLVWTQGIAGNTSFCQTDLAIDSASGDLLVAALEGSVLLPDIVAGRVRTNCVIRLSGTTGQVEWGLAEPRRTADSYQVEDVHIACLHRGKIVAGTTSWNYNFSTSKWESHHRYTYLNAAGQAAGASKVIQTDNPTGMAILSMSAGKDGNLLVSTIYADSLVGRFRPSYPAIFSIKPDFSQIKAQYFASRDGAKTFSPSSNIVVDPATGDLVQSTFITDTVTGSNVPIWEGYLRVTRNLAPRKVKTIGLGYMTWAALNQARFYGSGRLALLIGLGNDSSQAIVYTDTAGNSCSTYANQTLRTGPVAGVHPAVSETYQWSSTSVYQSGVNSLYDATLQIVPGCGASVPPHPRTKRLGRDTTICGASLTLRWPKSPCCGVSWSTGEATQEITVYDSDTIIVRDIGDCGGYPEADTIIVRFNQNGGVGSITPRAQVVCPGDTAMMLTVPRGDNPVLHWRNDHGIPFFDSSATLTGFVVPRGLPEGESIGIELFAIYDTTCAYRSIAHVDVARQAQGSIVTTDSVFFIADTRDSVFLWTVQPGTFTHGPIRNSILVRWDSVYGEHMVTALLATDEGCDSLVAFRYAIPRPPAPPDTIVFLPDVPGWPRVPYRIIYNIVTPNHDGQNDVFTFQDIGKPPFSLNVYSKWGKLVFQTDDYQMDFPQEAVPAGTYFFRLTAEDQVYKGWIEVVR